MDQKVMGTTGDLIQYSSPRELMTFLEKISIDWKYVTFTRAGPRGTSSSEASAFDTCAARALQVAVNTNLPFVTSLLTTFPSDS